MTKSSIATEYNEINENGRNGWMDKFQVKRQHRRMYKAFFQEIFHKEKRRLKMLKRYRSYQFKNTDSFR